MFTKAIFRYYTNLLSVERGKRQAEGAASLAGEETDAGKEILHLEHEQFNQDGMNK